MGEEDSWDNITPELLEDCAQLTKANSIDGMFYHFPSSHLLIIIFVFHIGLDWILMVKECLFYGEHSDTASRF
jgi:hypothetical protein